MCIYSILTTSTFHHACAGLHALGRALMPATELETGTRLCLEDLAAACRHAPLL